MHEIVLNEHSITVAPTVKTAEKWLIKLAQTIRQQVVHHNNRDPRYLWVSLNNNSALAKSPLGGTYTLLDFLSDPDLMTNQVVRLYLLNLYSKKSEYWDVPPQPASTLGGTTIASCKHGTHSCKICGIGFAFVREALVVSLPSSSTWNCKIITLTVSAAPALPAASVTVKHASDPSHIP